MDNILLVLISPPVIFAALLWPVKVAADWMDALYGGYPRSAAAILAAMVLGAVLYVGVRYLGGDLPAPFLLPVLAVHLLAAGVIFAQVLGAGYLGGVGIAVIGTVLAAVVHFLLLLALGGTSLGPTLAHLVEHQQSPQETEAPVASPPVPGEMAPDTQVEPAEGTQGMAAASQGEAADETVARPKPERAQPPALPPVRWKYVTVRPDAAAQHVGAQARVTLKDSGLVHEGVLRVPRGEGILTLEKRAYGGDLELHIPLYKVQGLQVLMPFPNPP